jgi:catechol 2,3-dioxygenase-like lactoylglutathione lyase family enzyme
VRSGDILKAMHDQTPVQIAWVTRDLDATETALTLLLGAKKWVRMPGVHFGPDTCTYRGRPADFVADISLSYAGDTQLELIAPVAGQSIYTEFLDRAGAGLHHVCVEAPDVDAFAAALIDAEGHGASVVQEGVMPGGMRFAYVSAEGAGVPYIEIAHIPPEIRAFFEYVKQEQQ